MHAVEREITKATKYKVSRKFDNRQDYLKSIFLSVQHLTDEDFDGLSDEAAAWANACVEAQNRSKDEELPDFDEVSDVVDDEDPDEVDDTEDESEDVDDEESDKDEEVEAEEEVKPEPEPAKKVKEKAKPKPKKAEKVDRRIPPKEPKVEKSEKRPRDGDVSLDKWGCIKGSKNSQVLVKYEQGATSTEISQTIGGKYYNLLAKMKANGHQIHKEGAIITLVHKDQVKVSSPKKTKK